MLQILKSRFRDLQQFRLFGILTIASIFCGLLVLGRVYMNRHNLSEINTLKELYWFRAPTYLFLMWNLFLAWVSLRSSWYTHTSGFSTGMAAPDCGHL